VTIPIEWAIPIAAALIATGSYIASIIQTRKALARAFVRIEKSEAIIMVNVATGKLQLPTGFDLTPGE
jgi:hypothetical protein